MADEISEGAVSGLSLTYGAYQPDGTVRTAAGTALTEVGSTGLYLADDANVQYGDILVFKIGSDVVGSRIYKSQAKALSDYDPPTRSELTSDVSSIVSEIDANETKIDAIASDVTSALATLATLATSSEITTLTNLINSYLQDGGTIDTLIDSILTDTADMQPKVDTINTRVDQSISTTESNIRGADSDTLETLSDQLDSVDSGSVSNPSLGD